jgi:uncharacterized protein YdhG (YjbR/CyaY superfamily)
MPAKKSGQGAKRTAASGSATSTSGFTAEERAAMRERAAELRSAKRGKGGESDERAVLDRIAEMPPADRVLGERLHAIIMARAPGLAPKLWYGMPAYARNGKVVCFFQGAAKFKTRYATLGFTDQASLDAGRMWPTAYALIEMTPAEEARIGELLDRAVR